MGLVSHSYHKRVGIGRFWTGPLGMVALEKPSNRKTNRDDSGLAGKASHEFESRWGYH